MAECTHCHQPLVVPYGAVVELLQTTEVIRTASRLGLHHQCASEWARAETERLRKTYGDDSNFSFAARVEVEH